MPVPFDQSHRTLSLLTRAILKECRSETWAHAEAVTDAEILEIGSVTVKRGHYLHASDRCIELRVDHIPLYRADVKAAQGLGTPVTFGELSVRLRNALAKAGILTWEQIQASQQNRFESMRNIGTKSIRSLRRAQERAGFPHYTRGELSRVADENDSLDQRVTELERVVTRLRKALST